MSENKVTIACLGSFIKLYDTTKEQRDELHDYFKFKDRDNVVYIKVGKFKKKVQNYFHPLNRTTKIIGIGFLDYIIAYFKKAGWKYEVQDFRKWSKIWIEEEIKNIDWNRLIKDPRDPSKWAVLYDYQIETLQECLRKGRGNVSLSTGSGKSVVFSALTKLYNVPTIIVFDEIQLVHQTYNEFVKMGHDPRKMGIVQGENDKPNEITFMTIQSRHKIYDFIEIFKLAIFDEAHTVRSDSYKQFMTHLMCSNRFGFSATLYDPSDPSHFAKVIENIGPIIYDKKDTRTLIDEGYLAREKLLFVKCDRTPQGADPVWTQSGQNYPELYKKEIVFNDYRNLLIAMICVKHKDDKIVILFESIVHDHGGKIREKIIKYMPDRHIKILEGKDSLRERQEAIDFFEKNKNGIIIASRIFNKGVNIKSVQVGINAAAGKSFIKAIQKPGRMLRKTEGKDSMIYYDFIDQNSKVFMRQSNQRYKTYKERGYSVEKISPSDL